MLKLVITLGVKSPKDTQKTYKKNFNSIFFYFIFIFIIFGD